MQRHTIPEQPTRRYYSSPEKDIVRRHFDLPLLESFHRRKGQHLRYFGLPGEDALDLKEWAHLIAYVAAAERSIESLVVLERRLDTELPGIRYRTHWGEVDRIILSDKGQRREIGGQEHLPCVGDFYERSVEGYVWHFDVVNLDYFGSFLPSETGVARGRARQRANSLRKLFELNRIDSWQPWILLVTVEARLRTVADSAILTSYLMSAREEGTQQTEATLNFILSQGTDSAENAMRLVHAVTAVMLSAAASNANLTVIPRGTVLYSGAYGRRMVHLAFEFLPNQEPIGRTVPKLEVIRAPLIRPTTPSRAPWFELLPHQCPGLTPERVRESLDFLAQLGCP